MSKKPEKTSPTPALPPRQALAAPGKWPVVGERAPRAGDAPWRVTVGGLADRPQAFDLEELRALGMEEHEVDVHCVTRWSKPAMRFGGVPLAAVLTHVGIRPGARFISFGARSEHDHSTSLRLTDALELGVLIAFTAGGAPLEEIHGGPVRTVVRGRYFYKSLKWLETIELLAEDRLGTWEAESGYHNIGDPWREERYIAADLDRREVRRLLAARDMSDRELLGLMADRMNLAGLDARRAVLRNASFNGAHLAGARFNGARLANARFVGADLTGADLTGADLDGADLTGADLSGANLTRSELFGTTFRTEPGAPGEPREARLNAATILDRKQIEKLSPVQQEFLKPWLR